MKSWPYWSPRELS